MVIPCYNHGEYLEEAVASVLAQSYSRFEIVIVNDGSTDAYTVDLLNSFDRPGCRVLHTENRGLPAARNTGIRETSGKYVCCLDADDKYHPDYFGKAAAILDGDREMKYGAAVPWVQLFGSSDVLWKTVGANTPGFAPFLQGLRNNVQSASMFRRTCWEEIGGFDETMTQGYEDWDFWIRMLHHGCPWYCIEEPLIYYRQKEESMVTRANEQRTGLLKTLIENNRDFFIANMIPLLQERDAEVRRLKWDIQALEKRLAQAGNSRECGAKLAALCRRLFSSGRE